MDQKILVVDDEAHIRMLIEQTLEDLEDDGVEILTATNGEEAYNTIKEEQPNLVFLDVMMPKMNGFDVCQKVKKEEGVSDTYIILLTAKGQDRDRQVAEDLGVSAFITKPFSNREVVDCVADLVQDRV